MVTAMTAIPTVNYHAWRTCNMHCRFCFATYDSVSAPGWSQGLPAPEARKLISALHGAGFAKITFAGGEPTLCPWLAELLSCARELALTTGLVSNGARLEGELGGSLMPHLDWLALSVDSLSARTNRTHGRAIGSLRVMQAHALVSIATRFRRGGVKLKINTVVTRLNCDECLLPFIRLVRPERWKIMRILPIAGENSAGYADLCISQDQFRNYLRLNMPPPESTALVVEDNDDMTDSYVMVDPWGRFIDNGSGRYRVSRRILDVGVAAALSDVSYDLAKFERRGGLYEW
jgi:radical S-adenosyl methionine domain-containing protein 2